METIIILIKAQLNSCNDVAKFIEMEKNFNFTYPLEYKMAMIQLKGECYER